MEALRAAFASSLQQLKQQQQQHAAGATSPARDSLSSPSSQPPCSTPAPDGIPAAATAPAASSSAHTHPASPFHNAASAAPTLDNATATTSIPRPSTPPTTTTTTTDPTTSTTPSEYTAPAAGPTTHATPTNPTTPTGYSGVDAAPDPLTACERALAALRDELRGFGADASDGTARVQREVDKRYEQVGGWEWLWEGEVEGEHEGEAGWGRVGRSRLAGMWRGRLRLSSTSAGLVGCWSSEGTGADVIWGKEGGALRVRLQIVWEYGLVVVVLR